MKSKTLNRCAALCIDGELAGSFCCKNGISINYRALSNALERTEDCKIEEFRFYASSSTREGILKFQALLGHQGIQVITFRGGKKTEKCPHCLGTYQKDVQKECDIVMSLDLWDMAVKKYNPLCLLTGDRDFVPLVARIRERFDKEVIIICNRGSLSPELAGVASKVLLLEDLLPEIQYHKVAPRPDRTIPTVDPPIYPQVRTDAQAWKHTFLQKVVEFCRDRVVDDQVHGPRVAWGLILHEACKKLVYLGFSPESCPLLYAEANGRTKCSSRACRDLVESALGKTEIVPLEDGHPWLLVGHFKLSGSGTIAA